MRLAGTVATRGFNAYDWDRTLGPAIPPGASRGVGIAIERLRPSDARLEVLGDSLFELDPRSTGVLVDASVSVFDDGTRTDGELYGEHVSAPAPTTQLRNALVDAALAQRKAIIASASARLLETPDAVEHVRLHAAYAQLDALLLGLMKRIALACASQRTRLGLQYTYKYHGIYGADFVTTAMSL